MSIKNRLIVIATLLVFLIIVSVTAQQVATLKNNIQSSHSQTRYLSYIIADEFRQSSMDLTRLCRTYVATGDQKYWDAYWNIVKWRNGETSRPSNVDARLYPGQHKKQADIMRELQFSPAEFDLLKRANNSSNALIATEEQAMTSIKKGSIVAGNLKAKPGESAQQFALRIVTDNTYHNEVAQIMRPVSQFFTELDKRTSDQLTDAQSAAGQWLNIAFICQLLAALTLAGLLTFILKAVFKPLNLAIEAMHNISQGDGDLTKRLNADGTDELSILGRGFNDFAKNIQSLVVMLRDRLTEITASSSQLSCSARDTEVAIHAQKSGTESLLSAIADIAPAIHDINDHASQAKTQTSTSDTEASNGRKVVEQAVDNIQQLSSEMNNAASVVETLAEDSDNIGSVLDVIRGIADQTNLLALNAAIEAARAGEQGRGFAVVADEVRSLAQRTQDSTSEIQSMIEKLQAGAKEAVTFMEQNRSRADICVEKTTEAGQSLTNIAISINAINDLNTRIATASADQSSTIDNIRHTVDQINAQISQTAQGSEQTAEISERTQQLTNDINNLMKQFIV